MKSKTIADMEGKAVFGVAGQKGKPEVSFNTRIASQGRRSMRFEYAGKGRDRGSISFVVDGAQGFNAIAFGIYCERYNGGSLIVSIRQTTGEKGKAARYKAVLKMSDFIDGWTSVRLVKDAALVFKQDGGVEPDWSKIRTVSFSLAGTMDGKGVFYLDNVRFEDVSGGRSTFNLLYNSSFEIATNPDVPDGWTRDLAIPPYGPEVWAIDGSTSFHGNRSLRVGVVGKYARSWGRHTRVVQGRDYTFSVHLKAATAGTKAELSVPGVGRATVAVGTDWKRYRVTGKATRTDTVAYVWLRSPGALWVDAAQLELGAEATAYSPAAADRVRPDEIVAKRQTLAPEDAEAAEVPSVTAKRVSRAPMLDGDLGDHCWQDAELMTPFRKLKEDVVARRKTAAMVCYDDRALYFAVRANEPEMEAVAALLEKSIKGPWGTDLIEIFIDLNHDRNTYYHFAANAKGERWEARHATKRVFPGRPSSWQCEWQAAGRLAAGGWTLEVAIPYTCFDLGPGVEVGSVIGVNVCREDPKSKEHSSWAFSHGAFHTPQAFGEVKGFGADLAPHRFEMKALKWRRGIATASLANRTGRDQEAGVELVAEGPSGERLRSTLRAKCKDGAIATLSAPVALHTDGNYALHARVVDEAGVLRFVSQPVEVRVSGASALDVVGTEFDFYTHEEAARARCFVELSKERCEQCTLSWSVQRDGEPVAEPRRVRPRPGLNEWNVPLASLPNGAYLLRAALVEAGTEIATAGRRFRKLPPAKHEVRINQWGRFLVCDGEPLLWYGFYDSLSRGDDQRWIDALKLMRGAHCNAVLNYVGGRAEHEKVGWALDQAHAHGLKMWVHLGWMLSYWIPKYAGRPGRYQSEEEALEALRTQVNRHKTHPALLGWCTLDEPGNRPTMFTKEYTERYYRLIKTLDPHHPCIFSHLTRPGETKVYGQATDLALMPFLARGGRYDSLFWEFWDAGLPVATNSPCFGALSSACREPTPPEQRVRMYKSLILGARGLCSYTFRCAAMDTWREFGRVGEELRTLAPILLTPNERLRVAVTPGPPDVFALLKAHEREHYVIAVNVSTQRVEARVVLVDVPVMGRIAPMFEGGEVSVARAGPRSFVLSMPAQSSAVVRVERARR